MVSTRAARRTGTPSTSAWNCISQRLRAAPPSARSSRVASPASSSMARMTSAVPYAIDSSAARARCDAVVPRVMPTTVPRASGIQCGAPNPTNAGTK